MFVRDKKFKSIGYVDSHEIVHTNHFLQATVGSYNGTRPVFLHFTARLYSDDVWRVTITADYLPTVHLSGMGDPLSEFVEHRRKFMKFFATPSENRASPW